MQVPRSTDENREPSGRNFLHGLDAWPSPLATSLEVGQMNLPSLLDFCGLLQDRSIATFALGRVSFFFFSFFLLKKTWSRVNQNFGVYQSSSSGLAELAIQTHLALAS